MPPGMTLPEKWAQWEQITLPDGMERGARKKDTAWFRRDKERDGINAELAATSVNHPLTRKTGFLLQRVSLIKYQKRPKLNLSKFKNRL